MAALPCAWQEYEKPLLDERSHILSKSTVKTVFYKIRDILQCHNMFHIELSEHIKTWDEDERIGNIFTASVGSNFHFLSIHLSAFRSVRSFNTSVKLKKEKKKKSLCVVFSSISTCCVQSLCSYGFYSVNTWCVPFLCLVLVHAISMSVVFSSVNTWCLRHTVRFSTTSRWRWERTRNRPSQSRHSPTSFR